MPGLVIAARAEQVRLDALDEGPGLGRQRPPTTYRHPVGAWRKQGADRADRQLAGIVGGQAQRRHDRDAHVQGDVLLDHLPAAHFQADAVGHALLLEDAVHQTPGDLAAWRQDQRVLRDLCQLQPRQLAEWVAGRGDQHLLEALHGLVAEVAGHIQQ